MNPKTVGDTEDLESSWHPHLEEAFFAWSLRSRKNGSGLWPFKSWPTHLEFLIKR